MAKKQGKQLSSLGLQLVEINPLTNNQEKVFASNKNLVLYGTAGTGKTMLSMYLSLKGMMDKEFSRLVLIRSAVPTRDIGFLPGTDKEKAAVYEEPYRDIAVELFERGDAYQILKQKDLVQFLTTSFLRGLTLRDSAIIIDESQNMSFQELDTIMTRVGEGCRIFFCGDFKQTDLHRNGMKKFLDILEDTGRFDFVHFDIPDIVRSGLVKDYIIARERYEESSTGR